MSTSPIKTVSNPLKYLGFNWKMNPNTLLEAKNLLDSYHKFQPKQTDLRIFVPNLFYSELQQDSTLKLGIQGISDQQKGSYTNQISPAMAVDKEVQSVLVGHSEARKYQSYSIQDIQNKLLNALEYELEVVWCLGYSYTGDMGLGLPALEAELRDTLEVLKKSFSISLLEQKLVLAYEPVWAIGTGKTATSQEISKALEVVQRVFEGLDLKLKVLYGGSINSQNIESITANTKVDGYLIGGAGLKPNEVEAILKFAQTDSN